MTRTFITLIFILLYSTAAFADAGFQFAMPGVQAPKDPNVNGMRLVFLYGKNTKVSGLDLGFASFNESVNQSGFTFNMGLSKVTGTSSGCACALINIHEGKDEGFNGAFVNVIADADKAVNVGFLNMTEANSAIDIGGLSMSKKSKTQIGIINFTNEIESLQIGFLNFADNGFFPVFPFFNYPKSK
jgi:hypothetical protein